MTFDDFSDFLTFDNLEDFLMTLATKAAPWLTPLVPAFFIGRAVGVHLETPGWVAVVAAASTEAVGVMAAKRALEAWDWNEQHTRKTDPVAPFNLSVWLALGYLFAGILLSVGLEVWGEKLAPFAPAVFFLLALIAYLSLALSWQQARWKRNLEAEQQEREANKDRTNEINALTDRVQELEAAEQRANSLTEQLKIAKQTANKLRTEKIAAERRAEQAEREAEHQATLRQTLAETLGKLIDGSDAEKVAVAQRMWPDLPQRSLAIIGGVSATTVNKIVNTNGDGGGKHV